jgi:Protein of unknown function (DUF1634)
MGVGWVASVNFRATPFAGLRTYAPRPLAAELADLGARGAWPGLVCYFGLFVLISLPLVRVLLTGVLFARQGDRVLAMVAFAVLAALVSGFFLGTGV